MTTYIEEIQGNKKVAFVAVEAGHNGTAPPNPWPPLPPLPPSGSTDSDLTDPFNADGSLNLNGQTPEQILTHQLSYISAHPGDPAAMVLFAKTLSAFVQAKLVNQSDLNSWAVNDTSNGNQNDIINVLKSGIDLCADYAFLYGYPDSTTAGYWSAVQNFISPLNSVLTAIQSSVGGPGQNAYIDGMVDETNTILAVSANSFESVFLAAHLAGSAGGSVPAGGTDAWGYVIQAGDVVWTDSSGFVFDWTQAYKNGNNTELQTINAMISGLDPVTGNNTFATIDNLDSILNKIQGNNLEQLLNEALALTGGDPSWAILIALNEMTNNSGDQLSGTADVMDKQHQISQQALAIENFLRGLSSGTASATDLRGNIASLFAEIDSSSQFTGLVPTLQSAMSTLQATTISYYWPNPPGAKQLPISDNIWHLLTDTTIPSDQLLSALQQGLTPNPNTTPPSPTPPSPTSALQGLIGAFDSIVTSVTSASTQTNTTASQIQSTIAAEAKVMTGVIDPNNGIYTGVIKNAIQHQISGS